MEYYMENGGGQVNRTEEKAKRFSQQRRLIYEDACNAQTAHPDVESIFAEVRKKLPDIGIATRLSGI